VDESRLRELAEEFGEKTVLTEFTDQGLPHAQEADLIREIWSALKESEKKEVVERIRKARAEELNVNLEQTPDPTPYAMRLMFYAIKLFQTGKFSG